MLCLRGISPKWERRVAVSLVHPIRRRSGRCGIWRRLVRRVSQRAGSAEVLNASARERPTLIGHQRIDGALLLPLELSELLELVLLRMHRSTSQAAMLCKAY